MKLNAPGIYNIRKKYPAQMRVGFWLVNLLF